MVGISGSIREFYTGDYRALEARLVSLVRDLRGAGRLDPILIIVTSRLLGIHLGRHLADMGVSHINIRFLTLEDLADQVALPILHREGKTRMPGFASGMAMAEALRSVMPEADEFYFRGIIDRPGFHEAMLSTIRDLEEALLSPEDLEQAVRTSDAARRLHIRKIGDLARTWKRYRQMLDEVNWVADYQVMRTACEFVPTSPPVANASSILVYGFYDLNALQREFLKRCMDTKHTVFFVPFQNQRAFEFAKPMIRWMTSAGLRAKAAAAADADSDSPPLAHLRCHIFEDTLKPTQYEDAVTFISAPGEAREAREIARLVTAECGRGDVGAHEVGVILRNPDSESDILRDTFQHLGAEPYVPEGIPLSQTSDGRSVLLLLDILVSNYARSDVFEFLTFAELRPQENGSEPGAEASVHRWDAASMAAGIVEGSDEWRERLSKLLSEHRNSSQEEPYEGVRTGQRSFDAADIAALISLMDRLIAFLIAVKVAKTWTQKSMSLLKAIRNLTQGGDSGGRVADAIARLSELDRLSSPPGQAEFRRAVCDLLDSERIRIGRFERQGPAVMGLMAARGIPFRMVVIPGMTEKAFPPVARQDAILLDDEREVINKSTAPAGKGPLHLKSKRRMDEERLLLRLAVGAARERLILTFPRLAIGTAKERLPSSFVLAAAEALTGRNVYFDNVENLRGFLRVPLAQIAVTEPVAAVDQVEFDLATALHGIRKKRLDDVLCMRRYSSFFLDGLRLEAARWGNPVLTAYDGIVAGPEARKLLKRDHSVIGRRVSPTRLEVYAGCPFAYLLGVIMGIEPLEEPERVRTISPLDKGTLVHSILWEFLTTLRQRRQGPLQVQQSDLGLLGRIAERRFQEFEQTCPVGYPLMWQLEKEEMLTYLGEFVEEEIARDDYLPAYFEVRYGMKVRAPEESEISRDEPVALDFGRRQVLLRGRIDRIDISRDGRRARIIDYKTGRARAKSDDLRGGTTLQLPLYIHAASVILKDVHPEVREFFAEYYHLAEQSKTKRHIGFSGECLSAKRGELSCILDTIADGIEGGLFFQLPGEDCRWCGFSPVCGSYQQSVFGRKRGDPRAAPFLRMRGDLGEVADTGEDV
jgi:ATP-dependent helicase/nuclease subunit B